VSEAGGRFKHLSAKISTMISAITGELRTVEDDRIHIASGPFLFEVLVPAADLNELRARVGDEFTFHTIFDIEGDATRGGLTPRLIGFLRAEDKRFFELFITVKGIGPKRALRALVQPTGQIAAAIEAKNTRALIELPEIGKRMAELIVAELAGKAAEFAVASIAPHAFAAARSDGEQLALEGAMALGIPRAEAEHLLDRARQLAPNTKVTEVLLREMLRLRTVRA
jgi:holliday junction DNA helicase RuvA